jgi:hypothetical protein
MIYTRKQLDEMIEAAEKEGWRPTTPMPGDIAYRGYPLTKRECTYPYTKREVQWRVSMTDGVRVTNVAVSEWVVEPIARL